MTGRKQLFHHLKVMPFGLCNAPSTFQHLMETVLAGLHWLICLVYLDDIIIHSRTFEDHLINLRKVLQQLTKAGLKIKPSKCFLLQKQVHYLGQIISRNGIETDPGQSEGSIYMTSPKFIEGIKAISGSCYLLSPVYQGLLSHCITIEPAS